MNIFYSNLMFDKKQEERLMLFVKVISFIVFYQLVTTILGISVTADDGSKLTDVFSYDALRGSSEWFTKINWVGQALNFIITIFSFIGVAGVSLQTVLTIAYFAGRSLWDNVSEIKKEYNGENILGGKKLFQDTFTNTKSGLGIDSLVRLFYIFIPDVKLYSEMGDTSKSKLNDDDNVVTYFVKTFPVKVFLILFLSMGFNGSLMQCYAMVVDGLGVFANEVVSINSEEFVENILSSGNNYEFGFAASGKPDDKVRQGVAKDIYRIGASKATDNGTENKTTMGKKIENQVRSMCTNAAIEALINSNAGNIGEDYVKITDADWKYVKFEVINSENTSTNAISIEADALLTGESSAKPYFNVYFTLTRKAPSHNYFGGGK